MGKKNINTIKQALALIPKERIIPILIIKFFNLLGGNMYSTKQQVTINAATTVNVISTRNVE